MNKTGRKSSNRPVRGDVPQPDDATLVARCQRGEVEAFDELVTRYRAKMFATIHNMVRNEQDAWDLAQAAFIKAWQSIGRFRGEAAFFTWLYRIAMNLTIDWVRKQQQGAGTEFDDQVALHHIDPASCTTPAAAPPPPRQLERDEIRRRIDAAIACLSPEHRQVILLREMDGLEYHEIAEAVGCELGTVMSRLFYARRKLQSLLRDIHANL